MSTLKSLLRSGTYVVAGAAALTLAACASQSDGARYGNVYDYVANSTCESNPCDTQAASYGSERYGETQTSGAGYSDYSGHTANTENVVYADCSVISGMNCNSQPAQSHAVYTPSHEAYPVAETYPAAQTVSDMSYGGHSTTSVEAAPCPSGTVSNGDGTCMESSYSSSSYGGASYGSTSSTSLPAECPSGTTMQGDGTCMEASYSSTASYGASSYATSSVGTAECPSGSSMQSDGTCMQSSYASTPSYSSSSYLSSYGSSSVSSSSCPSGSSMQGDGTCAMNEGTAFSNTTAFGGYTNSGSYTTQDYLPIRK